MLVYLNLLKIIFMKPPPPKKKLKKSLFFSLTDICKNAFFISDDFYRIPTAFFRNLLRMDGVILNKFGPIAKQLLNDGEQSLPVHAEALNTGRVFVVLSYLNAGICDK